MLSAGRGRVAGRRAAGSGVDLRFDRLRGHV